MPVGLVLGPGSSDPDIDHLLVENVQFLKKKKHNNVSS